MSGQILAELRDGILHVSIERPEKRNALDEAMFSALADKLTDVNEAANVAVVLIRGTADCFCAGHDRQLFGHLWPQPDNGVIARCMRAFLRLDKPLVAAVCGAAHGFGATLLLSADYVVCGENAVFAFPFATLGIVPEAAATTLLARRVGDLRARDWLLSGRTVQPQEALQAGLVTHVVADRFVFQEAERYAADLAQKPAGTLSRIRRLLRDGAARTPEAALAAELAALNELIPLLAASRPT